MSHCHHKGERHAHKALTTKASILSPVVTVGLAAMILSETMGPLQLCGGALILLAAIMLIRSETRQR